MTKDEYNKEPVFYCHNCLSLHVKELNGVPSLHVCHECGNTDIEETDIESWNQLYVAQYGKLFIEEDFDSIVE